MQVLTPTGYRDPITLANGDEVCAFDAVTGAAIINHVENIDFVDYAEWCRWWQHEEAVPPFNWVSINHGAFVLFREQSVWRNDGIQYVHARSLEIGDTIFDDHDGPIVVSHIDEYENRNAVWYRFDVSGDHSYILDGITVHNASRVWTGGTGSWTPSNTASWSGGAVPGAADTATFDGTSGGGTVTLNFGGTITVQSIITGNFTGTWDNSVNNNNITLSAQTAFNGSGTGTRTIKLGSATYTLSFAGTGGTPWTFTTNTGLTLVAGSETIVFSGVSQTIKTLNSGGKTFGALTINANCGPVSIAAASGATFSTITLNAGTVLQIPVTNVTATALSVTGSSSAPALLMSGTMGTQAALTITSGTQSLSWVSLRDMNFTGGATFIARNAFDNGNNTGITITPPPGVQPSLALGI